MSTNSQKAWRNQAAQEWNSHATKTELAREAHHYTLRGSLGHIAVHLLVVPAFFFLPSVLDLVLCASTYALRMFAVTAGYHRYLSHRSFKTSRAFQFILAALGASALQKGPLWWAASHRAHYLVPWIVLGLLVFAIGGLTGLVWGLFVSTVLTSHATCCVNSVCHFFGRRRYLTGDLSRNHWPTAILRLGEGWHNNHHYAAWAANQGHR